MPGHIHLCSGYQKNVQQLYVDIVKNLYSKIDSVYIDIFWWFTYCSLKHSLDLSSSRLPDAGILFVKLNELSSGNEIEDDDENKIFGVVDSGCGGGVTSSVEYISLWLEVEDSKSSL